MIKKLCFIIALLSLEFLFTSCHSLSNSSKDLQNSVTALEDQPLINTVYQDFILVNNNSFDASIELTPTQKYGKVMYTNKQNAPVKMRVKGQNTNKVIEISNNTSQMITWENNSQKNQIYDITIMCDGSKELNGLFTLLSSDKPLN